MDRKIYIFLFKNNRSTACKTGINREINRMSRCDQWFPQKVAHEGLCDSSGWSLCWQRISVHYVDVLGFWVVFFYIKCDTQPIYHEVLHFVLVNRATTYKNIKEIIVSSLNAFVEPTAFEENVDLMLFLINLLWIDSQRHI